MAFDFKSQTKTNKTIVILVTALVIINLIWWIVSLAAQTDRGDQGGKVGSVATSTATSTSATSTGTNESVTPPKNAVALGTYSNGTHVGYIRSMSKTNSGFTFTIDFVEWLSGKEAFLAAAAIADKNPQYNWDMMNDRYQTYTQLAAGIRKLTNTEFEALYYDYQRKWGSKDGSGILTAFPNGFIFIRNSNSAVRVIPGDKRLGSATVSNASTQITMDDLYLICRTPTPAILDAYYRKYNAGVTCENPVQFKISKGMITGVEVIYRP